MAVAGTVWVSTPIPVARSMLCSSRLFGGGWTPSPGPATFPGPSASPPSKTSARRPVGAPAPPPAGASRTATPPGRNTITRPAAAMPTTQAPMITMAASVRSMSLAIMPESRFVRPPIPPTKRDECQKFMEQRPGKQRGDLARVVLRLHLDQVEADELDSAEAAHQPQRIAAARSADFRRPGPWGESRVDEIDVEGKKHGTVADPPADFGQHIIDATRQQLLGWNQMKPERPRTAAVLRSVQRTTDPELDGAFRIDQPFLDRTLAPGAMGIALAPVAIPGVGVRVEIDQSNRAMPLADRPQLAERNAVVAPDGQRDDARVQDRPQAVDHHFVAGLDVARHHRQVPGVDHREMIEDLDLMLDVVRAQQPRALPDRCRPEAAPDPVADRGIEGNAHHRCGGPSPVIDLGQAHEAADAGEARRDHR